MRAALVSLKYSIPEDGGPGVPVGLSHIPEYGLGVRDPPGGVAVRQEEDHGLHALQDALLLHVRHNRQRLHYTWGRAASYTP